MAGAGLLSYLLSFVCVGIYWNNHHHMFQLTELVTGGILWASLGLLFWLLLFPYSTQWMEGTDYARTPVIVYGVNLLMAALAYYVLQSVIIRSQGKDSALRKAVGRDFKGSASTVGYTRLTGTPAVAASAAIRRAVPDLELASTTIAGGRVLVPFGGPPLFPERAAGTWPIPRPAACVRC